MCGVFRSHIALATWTLIAALSVLLSNYGKPMFTNWHADWIYRYPRSWVIPLKDNISSTMYWLVEDATFGIFTVREFFRFFSSIMEIPLQLAINVLSTGLVEGTGGNTVQLMPPLGWIAIISIVVAIGHKGSGWNLAIFAGGCFLYLAIFKQWESAMTTLSSIVVAVPFGVVGGLSIGIASYKWKWAENAIRPILDLMQTVPVFAYLVPILFLFGFGPVSAMIATIIYAMPPMIRATTFGLKNVPSEIQEFGTMAGCDKRQLMFKVLVPNAVPTLMVGVNQVIMLSLNMVIIASMIGAGGLGYDVLIALRRLDIGGGLEAGIAIVVLAIAIDRLSHAYATRRPDRHEVANRSFIARNPRILICAAVVLISYCISLWNESVLQFPAEWQLTTANSFDDLVRYLNVNFYSVFEAVKLFLLTTIMLPVKLFLINLPWPWVFLLMIFAGYRLGGFRLAGTCLVLLTFVLITGQWEKAMITVYLCGISVIFATILGVPIGILAAEFKGVGKFVRVLTDTLQTLPSFVYLIPVVMFFQSGDFSAMIAVVLYALAPAIKYTTHGISHISPALIEAGKISGCTSWQLLRKVKLPLALPEIMLGLNQTIMLALSMLVVTALVGTRDLGQEVFTALQRADTGLGVVAGLSIAFIAIIADRFTNLASKRIGTQLGV